MYKDYLKQHKKLHNKTLVKFIKSLINNYSINNDN